MDVRGGRLAEEDEPQSDTGITSAHSHDSFQSSAIPKGVQQKQRGQKTRPPMRSSIACLRCRRSKIKCDNDGGSTPCETCVRGGHNCQYPEVVAASPRRIEVPIGRHEKDNRTDRKKLRRSEDFPEWDDGRCAAYAEEILSYPFLTTEVWEQVFGIFKLHFSTELSFLHFPSLKEMISRRHGTIHEPSPDTSLVLLGVLTLSARFHPDIVKYVTHLSNSQGGIGRPKARQIKSDPSVASNFFAHALEIALGPLRTSMTMITPERVQAFLMLAMHEWIQGTVGGIGAWMYAGVAIRMAQSLKLGFDYDEGPQKTRQKHTFPSLRDPRLSSEQVIAGEISRRTMFSCMFLDRLLCCGTHRRPIIRTEDLRIQLPSTDMAFDLAMDVRSGYLKSSTGERDNKVSDVSVLGHYAQLVDIWSRLSEYVEDGGRFSEDCLPWEPKATFKRLKTELDNFNSELPETFTLSRRNYYRHDNHQAAGPFISLHMLESVCQIVLHREYLPFIACRCTKPGEATSTICPELERTGYNPLLKGSAEKVFQAAQNILFLIETCRDKLPISCLTLFATWSAGIIGLYAQHFPAMDTQQILFGRDDSEPGCDGEPDTFQPESLRLVHQTLSKMKTYISKTQIYITHLRNLDSYLSHTELEFHRQHTCNDQADKEEDRGPPHPHESDAQHGIVTERASSAGVDESYHPVVDYVHSARSTPSLRSIPIKHLDQAKPESSNSIPELHRGNVMSGENLHVFQASLQYPANWPDLSNNQSEKPISQQPVSPERCGNMQSLRFASVLNDIQEFSGAGSLGDTWDIRGGDV